MQETQTDLRVFRGRCYGCLDNIELALKADLPPPASRSLHDKCRRGLIVWDLSQKEPA